jgi:hypothetical protein
MCGDIREIAPDTRFSPARRQEMKPIGLNGDVALKAAILLAMLAILAG